MAKAVAVALLILAMVTLFGTIAKKVEAGMVTRMSVVEQALNVK